MGKVDASLEIVGKKGALADITNCNGKRMRSMDSLMNSSGTKIVKYKNGDKLGAATDECKDGSGVDLFILSDDKGENDISGKLNPTDKVSANCEGSGDLHCIDGEDVSDCLKVENLSSQNGKGKNSSESLVESGEICSEDEYTDSDDSARYPFHAGQDFDGAASLGRNELNFLSTQESSVVSSDGPSNNVTPVESVVFGSSKQSVLGMENLLNESSKCGESCKCSFCLKAAYMFSDLHYQDARGRLSALKRSRRLARSLEGRLFCDNSASKTTIDNSKRSNDLDSDLTQQWRSLFLHSEGVLAQEASHLQHGTLLMLKELRENCKKDLEMISVFPSNK